MTNLVEVTIRAKDDADAGLKAAEAKYKLAGQKSASAFSSGFSRGTGRGLLGALSGRGSVVTDAQRAGQDVGLGLSRGMLSRFQSALGGGLLGSLFGTSAGQKLFGNAGASVQSDAKKQGTLIAQGLATGLNAGFATVQSKMGGVLSALFGGAGAGPDMAAGEQSGKDTATGFLRGFASHLGSSGGGGSFISRFMSMGGSSGGAGGLASGVASGAGPGIPGVSGLGSVIATLGAVLVSVLPAITAVAGGLTAIGGGFAVLELTSKSFAAQMKNDLGGIESVFKAAVQPMARPLEQAASQIVGYFKSIGPELKDVFAAAVPLIQPLVKGFEEMTSGLLPGFLAMIKAAGPVFKVMAGAFADLGKSLGEMFSDFAKAEGPSAVILKAVLDLVNTLFPILGKLGEILATALAPAVAAFGKALDNVLPALIPVGRVLADLAGAVLSDLASVLVAVSRLLEGLAPSFAILGKALGTVFNVLENSGVFAVLANALESLAKPLAQLINGIVIALAPALPPLIKAVGLLASMMANGLAIALVLIIKALTPILVLTAKLIAITVEWMAKNQLLIPVLIAIAAAIDPVGTAIGVLGIIVGEFASHWHQIWGDIKKWGEDAWNFLTHGWGQFLVPGLTLIRVTVDFIASHWQQAWNDIQSVARDAWNAIHNTASDFWDTLTRLFRDGIDGLVGFFESLPGRIIGALKGAGSDLYSWGHYVLTEMFNGIKSVWSDITGFFSRLPGDILHALGIHSPPDWAIQAGKDIMSGIGIGMSKAHSVAAHARGLIPMMTGALSGSAATAQSFAASILPRGWSMSDLIALWNRESGWNSYAVNPSSGAYGIPQSLGHGHPYNLGDYKAQIIWGLNYIASTYGNSQGAWAHEESYGWYDKGGWLPTGRSIAINNTGRPERVLGPGEGGRAYSINVNVAVGANPAETGRQIVNAIREFERGSGTGWRS